MRKFTTWMVAGALLAVTAGSSAAVPLAAAVAVQPGQDSPAVGFIFVGSEKDYGYNEAAYMSSLYVQKMFPKLKVYRAANIPETAEVTRIEEDMISQGARIIFATSFGYLQPTLQIIKKYPNVMFLWQGGGTASAPNLSNYFGNSWQSEYLAGMVAGKMTKTEKLGFVGGFPISQILLDVNAFERGAQSVNPKVTTRVVFSGGWANPSAMETAANTLIGEGVDVIAQHQDATQTIIEAAKRAGIYTVGYHFNAESLAPNNWLTGEVWNWNKIYTTLVSLTEAGKLKSSKYYGMYYGGMEDGMVQLAPFGPKVPKSVRNLMLAKERLMKEGKFDPFEGPVVDQQGKVEIPAGHHDSFTQLNEMNYFVKGVIGSASGQ